MADRKRMNIGEFRDAGFLLEANRQFFHPHGLALEVTRVTEDEGTPIHSLALNGDQHDELCALLTASGASTSLVDAVHAGMRYEVGDCWLSGVRDARDDPEGVYLVLTDAEREKVKNVAAERARRSATRAAFFGADTDVEPVDWAPKENIDA